MVENIIRVVVVVALMGALVYFWLNLDQFGIEGTTRFYVVGGGASVAVFGILYKLLGSWDLIPDWIPLLGEIDDMIAWGLVVIGALVAGGGYYFMGGIF